MLCLLAPSATSQQYLDLRSGKTLKYNSHIERVVGDGLGGSVALELQKYHPELKLRTYETPVVDP